MNVGTKIGGRLKYFLKNWQKITNNNFVLSIIQGYNIPLIKRPSPIRSKNQRILSIEESKKMKLSITSMIKKVQ